MIFSPLVQTLLLLNIVFVVFAFLSFLLSIDITRFWNIDSTSKKQYTLEKRSVLGATIIKYIFILKLPLFLFFIFTLDSISNVLTGAMCAAGVVDATKYGTYLIILKVLNIYVFASWLLVHYLDIKHENMPYTRIKFSLFGFLFVFLLLEIILEFSLFLSLDIDKMVSCCGVLYSSTATSYVSQIFSIKTPWLLGLFYGNFFLLWGLAIFKRAFLFALLNGVFLFVAVISLIVFFGTYIYELPTHHCPFCLLQKDYYYVGYVLYSTLFMGTFSGIGAGLMTLLKHNASSWYKVSLGFNTLYMVTVSLYVLVYFFRNGVWL